MAGDGESNINPPQGTTGTTGPWDHSNHGTTSRKEAREQRDHGTTGPRDHTNHGTIRNHGNHGSTGGARQPRHHKEPQGATGTTGTTGTTGLRTGQRPQKRYE